MFIAMDIKMEMQDDYNILDISLLGWTSKDTMQQIVVTDKGVPADLAAGQQRVTTVLI